MNDPQLTTQITTQVLNQYLECITIKKTQTSKTERIYSSSKVAVERKKYASPYKGAAAGLGKKNIPIP